MSDSDSQVISAENRGWPPGKRLPVETSPPKHNWYFPDKNGRISEVKSQ